MARKSAPTVILILIALSTVAIVTPLVYRKVTNYYISKKVKQKFNSQGKELPFIVSLPEMIIPLNAASSHLMALQIGLQIPSDHPELSAEIIQKQDQLREVFTETLRQYNMKQLKQVSNKNVIKGQSLEKINQLLESVEVSDIFFEKYLIMSSANSQKE